MRRRVRRSSLVFALAITASGIAASTLAAKPAPLRITAPSRALQGKTAVVAVKSARSFGCLLSVRYSNGDKQSNMLPTTTQSGKAVWQWHVPEFAAAGQAKLTVSCPGAGKATKSVIVVGGLIPPKIEVLKSGYSTRLQGTRENVSYGLVLQNTSPNGNALNVIVLVNFVMPDNHLIGSASTRIPIINAGSSYNLGGQLGFTGSPPITRLEVVINPGGRARSDKSFSPGLDNVHLVPNPYDPAWLGSIEGDLINVHPSLTLTNSTLSAVVFDANGTVLGGGYGSAFFQLLPGTRSFFKIASGLDAIPFNSAASVAISVLPTYATSAP